MKKKELKVSYLSPRVLEILKNAPKYKKGDNWGWLYAATNSVTKENKVDCNKVGVTQDLYRRLVEDANTNPCDATVFGNYIPLVALRCDMCRNVERDIHRELKEYRIDGRSKEWFNVSLEVILKLFEKYSRYSSGSEIVCLTDDENIQKLITDLLNKQQKDEDDEGVEYFVDRKTNRVYNKPKNYRRHKHFNFTDIGIKEGDTIMHYKFKVEFEVTSVINNTIKYLRGDIPMRAHNFDTNKVYSLTDADNLLWGYDYNKHKAGQKAYITKGGEFLSQLWNSKRTDKAYTQHKLQEQELW